ncbi:MAG: hypothetical protein U0350_14610 [Caldilineaceae bacterium]
MTILLEQHALPDQGTVELDIHRIFEIKITAEQARRQVNRWIFTEVSSLLGARTPKLVVGERVVWRVPVVLTAPHLGEVGLVGEIDVDVQNSDMDKTPACVAQLEACCRELGKRLPPYTSCGNLPQGSLAKNFQPTHSKPMPNQAQIEKVAAALAAV